MSVKKIHDHGQTLHYPSGKLLGIVGTQAELKALAAALSAAGFDEIESLHGEEGVRLLERIGRFFFSDLEATVINRHIYALRDGHIIVAIKTPSDRVDEVVSIASKNGAHRLVHFGPMTVTCH